MSITDFFDDDRPIKVHNTNDMRHGSFEIHKIKGNFPIQSITSTNLHHAEDFENPNFDFKTNIVEIVEWRTKKFLDNSDYREKRIKKVSKLIEENPDKLCLFALKGARSNFFKTTRKANEILIDFQVKCGFKLIRVYFKYARNILKESRYCRKLIPEGRSFVALLDENLSHAAFRKLYLECNGKRDNVITFLGRKPSKKTAKKIHNRLNFEFISSRKNDKILRLISLAPKSINGTASSLIYYIFRFDVYSFSTRRGNQDIPDYKLNVLNGFFYEILTKDTKLVCPITGKNLYVSSKEFEKKLNKSSLPVSVHDIVRLNEIFKTLHKEYTREQLVEKLEDKIP